jgi:hypothetical protein
VGFGGGDAISQDSRQVNRLSQVTIHVTAKTPQGFGLRERIGSFLLRLRHADK